MLGASNYTFAEAFADQHTESFLTAHVHAFTCFGGAADLIVPDYVPGHIFGDDFPRVH